MESFEFKKKILEATNVEWFKTVKIDFRIQYLNHTSTFVGFAPFHEFLLTQKKGWESINGSVPERISQSKEFFVSQVKNVENFLADYITTKENYTLTNSWTSRINNINSPGINVFLYDSPETNFLLTVYSKFPKYFNGAFDFIIGSNQSTEQHNFIGRILSYEFLFKDNEITNRKNAEKPSFSKLRSEYEKRISQAEEQLVSYLETSKIKSEESVKFFDELSLSKKEELNNWYQKTLEDTESFFNDSSDRLTKLEETYSKKLQLEEPAKYWKDRGNKLRMQAQNIMTLILVLVVLVALFLGTLLWGAPNSIFISWTAEDKSPAIRWSIIFITFLSFVYLAIRALSKYMFSTFHLARDCEERYTLTYFYLSLLKTAAIDPNERLLIMQSLFSRADTGLLKEDSSPTMPNDYVSKVLGK